NSNNESGFVIEKLNETGEWEEIFTTVYDVTEFIDKGLKPGTEYQYRIKAVNSAGESDYAECQVITEGIAGISWEVISASQIKVKWEDTPNEDGYKVDLFELSEDGGILDEEAVDTQNISGNTTYCYFVLLEPGKEYRVRLTSIKGEEEVYMDSDIIRTSCDPKGGLF
ncbi:MAG: fibronectin type III domain-containing protein, partial [Halanaerobiales bacterium]